MHSRIISILTFLACCGSVAAQGTGPVRSGTYAVQLNRTTVTTDSGLDRDAPGGVRVPVTPGQQLIFSFWARNAQANPSTIDRAALVFFTSGGTYINPPGDVNFQQGTVVPATWTQYTASPVTVPATAAQMNVSFRLQVNSSLALDDVSVLDFDPSGARGPIPILTNGGFENFSGPVPDEWRFFGAADGSLTKSVQVQNSVQGPWHLY